MLTLNPTLSHEERGPVTIEHFFDRAIDIWLCHRYMVVLSQQNAISHVT